MGENDNRGRLTRPRGLRAAVTTTGIALALAASSVAMAPQATAEWAQPAFVETIGGSGRPAVFAWGLQYNPVSGELVVGDYLNYQVRRFALDGSHLGDFFRSNNKGQPYSLGVDPNDGAIYVPEIADGSVSGTIAKYDAAGNFLYAVNTSADYYAWITVDDAGDVYVADSHYWNDSGDPPRIRVYRFDDAAESASQIDNWSVDPSGMEVPRMYGIDVASDGTVYASDAINKVVHRWENDGTYLGSFGDGHFVSDLRSVTIDDANGWVYVVDAHGGKIEKFTLDGVHSGTLGSLGPADGQLLAPRQATIGPAGQVYVADYGSSSVEQFEPDGTWVQTIPQPSRRSPAAHLAQPRDVDVDAAGNVWVADSWNQRIQKFASGGAHIAMWGQRGFGQYGMNYPRGIGIDPATQNVWVANERGHHISVYDPTVTTKLFTVGSEAVDSRSTGYLRWPNDIEFHGGDAYVGDRVSQRVKVFDTATGDELWSISRRNHGLALDPATGDVFVVDRSGETIYKYDSDGDLLFSFGSEGNGDGQFQEPKDAVVSDGVLWVTDEQLSRVQAFDLDGNYLGKWGGYGSNAYQFKNPVGIAADDAGKLYIADSGNDRIVVYDTTVPRPSYVWSRPDVSVTSPSNGQAFSETTMISGNASDTDPIANVEIAVQDQSSDLWWNGTSATWESGQTWNLAPLAGPATARSFSWAFLGGSYERSYEASVRARDVFDTVSDPVEVRTFSVSSEPVEPDTEDPDGTVSSPIGGQTFSEGDIVMTGDATDDIGVTHVDVAIKDSTNNVWWDGSAWGGFTWIEADVTNPSATATPWEYTLVAPPAGSYGMTVRAKDAAGNFDAVRPWVSFTVSDGLDQSPPDSAVAAPTPNQVFPPGPVALNGTATDDIGVVKVELALKDTVSGLWWTGAGWGGFTYHDATLSNPGDSTTDWDWSFDPGSIGSFGVLVRAKDAAGNVDPTRPWIGFIVSDDGTPPDSTVTSPARREVFPLGTVDVAGTATDDTAVARVEVAVKDTVAGLWWTGSDWGSFTWHETTLDDPGSSATDWAWSFDPGVTGSFGLVVKTDDTSSNTDPSRPWIPFSVE